MVAIRNTLLILSVSLLAASCQRQMTQSSDYISWVEDEDNGLVVKKEIDGMEYNLLYKPHDYILAKEYSANILDKGRIEARRKELGDLQYFTLRIRAGNNNELMKAGIANEQEYYARLEYFMSGMQSDLYLVEGKDTLPCRMQHYERTYGMSPWNNFVLGFDNPEKNKQEDKLLVYEDKVLGNGKVMLKIKYKAIENVPALTLK